MRRKYVRRSLAAAFIVVLALACAAGCAKKQEQADDENTVEADRVVEAEEIQSEEEPEEKREEESAPVEEQKTPVTLDELGTQIQSVVSERQVLGEKWSAYVKDLVSGAAVSVGNESLESASLIKLFTAAAVFRSMDEVTARETYAGETLELMRQMIRVSDNNAANELVRRLGGGDAAAGMQKVNAFCQEYGFYETHMGRLMLDFGAADDNYTSVGDCGRLLEKIYRNELTGADIILSFMKEQERTGKIPAGLPAGTASANKTGELDDVENDAAVVFAGTGDYIVCVMSNHLTDTPAARNKIVEVSGVVYRYLSTF